MLEKEAILLIDVPRGENTDIYVSPVRDSLSPLDVLVNRMMKVVPQRNIVLLTGRGPQYSVFNRFVAVRNLSLFPTKDDHLLKRVLTAVAARRIDTVIRVNANHVFADPDLIESLANFHMNLPEAAYSFIENVPQWAGGEVLSTDALQRGFEQTRLDVSTSLEPGDYFKKYSGDFSCHGFSPPAGRGWPTREYSLANIASAGTLIDTLRQIPDPVGTPASQLPG